MGNPIINSLINSGGISAGISWGDVRNSGDGVGLTHNIGANAAVDVQAFKADLDNTQSNALTALFINLGTSAQGHIGINVNARGNSTNQTAYYAVIEGGSGAKILDVATAGNQAGFNYVGANPTILGNIAFKDYSSAQRSHSHQSLNLFNSSTNASEARTLAGNSIVCRRITGSNVSDDYDALYINKHVQNSSNTFNSVGSVTKIELTANTFGGTLNASDHVLELVQDALSTGFPIDIIQNAVVSLKFKKFINCDGSTIWKSIDGTAANGNLSGVQGDICLNGGTAAGQTAYCNSTGTNWTDM